MIESDKKKVLGVCACAHRRGKGLTSSNLLYKVFSVAMAGRAHCKGTNKDRGRLVGRQNDRMKKKNGVRLG